MEERNVCLKGIGLAKSFKGADAIKDVDFSLHEGEIHSILGAKGAGKTTLMRMLSGALAADGGYIEINGKKPRKYSPSVARENGVISLYESQYLMQDMTVAENIFMGEYVSALGAGAFTNYKKQKRITREIISKMNTGADIDPDELPVNMDDFEKQIVQMARVYAADAKIVLADEIATQLPDEKKAILLRILQDVAANGAAVVYFTHKIEDAVKISGRITVLRDGKRACVEERRKFDTQVLMREMVGCDEKTVKCLELTRGEEDEAAFFKLSKAAETNDNILDYLKDAVDFINENLGETISPKMVADAVHLSSGYLMLLFKNHMDTSIMEYTYKRRIDKSKRLLMDKTKKISDIALDVGIPNSQYFSVLFKKYTGMTPKEFRKTNAE